MGCDYYIIKQLKIEHSDGIDTIELDREKCYFPEYIFDDLDSDDSCYDKQCNEYLNRNFDEFLKVTYKPRVLFENYEWKNDRIKNKYIDMVFEKLKHYNNAFDNIHSIIKEEVRHLR